MGNKLSNILTQNNLYQIINEPTRYFSNEPAILDLMITDCPHLVLDTAPWGVPYSLYDNLDNVFNFNNSIITSTCKEHIISKNVTIHTKDKPWMCIEVPYDIRKKGLLF